MKAEFASERSTRSGPHPSAFRRLLPAFLHLLLAAISVLSLLMAAWLLLGPLPAFGGYYLECGNPWSVNGPDCSYPLVRQITWAAIALLVAIPSTALWVRLALERRILAALKSADPGDGPGG